MDKFSVGEVAEIFKGDYAGCDVTILGPLAVHEGIHCTTGAPMIVEGYRVHIHGVIALAKGDKFVSPENVLRKKKPPAELRAREEVGEWKLCPWRPANVKAEI